MISRCGHNRRSVLEMFVCLLSVCLLSACGLPVMSVIQRCGDVCCVVLCCANGAVLHCAIPRTYIPMLMCSYTYNAACRNCYGPEGLAMVETNTVLCSGTTFGSRNAILGYVRRCATTRCMKCYIVLCCVVLCCVVSLRTDNLFMRNCLLIIVCNARRL